nr:MAG TPA: hypothetical protein [Caudoviricetes sp.]
MRKEDLLYKKGETIKNLEWYVKNVMTDEDLKCFSISQLEKLTEIIKKAEEYRESCETFLSLSANEVVQKSTGRIAYFEQDQLREESHDEVMTGASWRMYEKYLNREKA